MQATVYPWWDRPGAARALRIAMGLLLVAETVLAMGMTVLVGEIVGDPYLFPSPIRYAISSGGVIAGLTLVIYCATLSAVTLTARGKSTSLQQRIRRKARQVHLGVGLMASVVYAWTFWSIEAIVLGTATLMILAFVWSGLVNWTLAPRPHEVEAPGKPSTSEVVVERRTDAGGHE